MFLIRDGHDLVFLKKDPTYSGFSGSAEGDVVLYYPRDVRDWHEGEQPPKVCTGVSSKDAKLYKVFKHPKDCRDAGYKVASPAPPKVFDSWVDYTLDRIQADLMPEHAMEVLAINLETGEYVLGATSRDAFEAFHKRWPDKAVFQCRVDGGPSIKFHRK